MKVIIDKEGFMLLTPDLGEEEEIIASWAKNIPSYVNHEQPICKERVDFQCRTQIRIKGIKL